MLATLSDFRKLFNFATIADQRQPLLDQSDGILVLEFEVHRHAQVPGAAFIGEVDDEGVERMDRTDLDRFLR
jgi:hypothetical protein